MIVAVPEDKPLNTPVVLLIVATVGLLLAQVPPPVASLNVAVLHIAVFPVIAGGSEITVTEIFVVQPVPVV